MEGDRQQLRLQVGGTVNPRTGVYIIRPSDDELLQHLERGEYANVLCSRQMGKSSLLMRTKARLIERGYAVAAIDVAGILGSPKDAHEWYQGLLDEMVRQLRLEIDVSSWWMASRAITPNQKLIQFFRDEIARKCVKRIVVFLDEIDSTFKLEYTDDFFVAIRAMYNERPAEPLYDQITFCLVGVASPNELIKDPRTTPYNVGRTIELQDFDPKRDNLTSLCQAVAADPVIGDSIVQKVLQWTGGHPYLTVRLCDQLTTSHRTADEELNRLLAEEFSSLEHLHSDVHFQEVLRFLGERIDDRRLALTLYRRVLSGEQIRDHAAPAHIAIKLAGLVKRDNRGYLIVRNEIYARIFSKDWVAKLLKASAQGFNRLLELLAPDRELAGEEYERLHHDLVAYFTKRRSSAAEDLADETLDRVMNRVEKGEIIGDLRPYCFGVAKRVLYDYARRKPTSLQVEELLAVDSVDTSELSDLAFECLDKCLDELSEAERDLIIDFYRYDKLAKIEHRREMAARLGIAPNALRVRIYRIRRKLEYGIEECLNSTSE